MILNHFPIYVDGTRFGFSFDESQESQMTRVDLIREKLKDLKDIAAFVDKFFEDNTQGIVFKVFEELCINFSAELYFIVFNLFQECIPCYRNYLKARSNYNHIDRDKDDTEMGLAEKMFGGDSNSKDTKPQLIEIGYPWLGKSKDRCELEVMAYGKSQQNK